MNIQYIKGDATDPVGEKDIKIICHVCNDVGRWGKGFVLALSKKWKKPELEFRNYSKNKKPEDLLGNVLFVVAHEHHQYSDFFDDKNTKKIIVANMIAQRDIKRGLNGEVPIRYGSLYKCFKRVLETANWHSSGLYKGVSIHMPRLGCGLAGGEWYQVENIIENVFEYSKFPIYVYDL